MPNVKSLIIADAVIINKIYYIRNQKVMLDRDLAVLYGVKAIRLREQVKRNLDRFPLNFMFQLKPPEVEDMVSQNAIPSKKHLGGTLPYAFTEHGVLMLANVLKSERALQTSIKLIEIFVKMREILSTHKNILMELQKIEKKLTGHDEDIQLIFAYIKQILNEPQKRTIIKGFRKN